MHVKTSKDLVPSLRGSAFRRVVCDGRCWYLRAIRTVAQMRLQRKPPVGATAASARRGTA